MLQFMYINFPLVINGGTTRTHFLFVVQQSSIHRSVYNTERKRVPLRHYCIHFSFLPYIHQNIIINPLLLRINEIVVRPYPISCGLGFLHEILKSIQIYMYYVRFITLN